MEPLRIGLNLVFLIRRAGGVGRYARELIPELLAAEPGASITAFVSRELDSEDRQAPWAEELEWVRLPVTVTHGPPWRALRSMQAQWLTIARLARERRLDVVHGLANIGPLVAPGVATVVTLHDLIWLRHPDSMSARDTLAMKLTAIPSARMADRVITGSRAARDDMVDTLGLEPSRIDVVPHGVRQVERDATPEPVLRERLALGDRPVVLCVSGKRTHKNLATLVRAVATLEAVLVVPGSPTSHEAELRRLASELGIAERVRFPDWLDDDELEGLYRLAACFVLPSFEEGFGLPVLDAMARGVPVCCSAASSLPEVAGDAALLFDPHDTEEVRAAIRRLLEDRALAADLAERGRARAATFTWRRAAEETLASYRRAVDGQRLLSFDGPRSRGYGSPRTWSRST
jgi:glycosyltransferase involved in cell wall biosynthesis